MKTLFIFFLLNFTVFALDPWDIKSKNSKSEKCDCQIGEVGDIIGDVLYKKLVLLILSKGRFNEIDNYFDGNIDFHIPNEDYKIMKEYISSQTRLTPLEIRKIDGILTESVRKPSKVVEIFTTFWDYFSFAFKRYFFHMVISLAVICIVFIIKKSWSKFSKQHFLLILIMILYIWEVKNTMELDQHEEYVSEITRCTSDFIFFKRLQNDCLTIQNGSNLLKVANPLYLLPKIVFRGLHSFWEAFDKINCKISGNLNHFISTPVYLILNTIVLIIIPLFILSMIFNYFFGTRFDFNFLFFNFRVRERLVNYANHHPSPQTQQIPNGKNNDENVTKLIGIVEELIQVKNTEKPNLAKPQEKLKPRIKKISSVPDNLSKLGGGDYVRR